MDDLQTTKRKRMSRKATQALLNTIEAERIADIAAAGEAPKPQPTLTELLGQDAPKLAEIRAKARERIQKLFSTSRSMEQAS